MTEKPLVSIGCITYNHAPYIRQCIKGFLMQKTNFPFEIIINDDCSTDGTTEIIKEYEKQYPNLINAIYHSENQYSKGVKGIFWKYVFSKVRGKYIAMCEGDDYWTDPYKLKRQIEYLELHKNYIAISENGIIHYIDSNKEELFSNKNERDIDIEELIKSRQFPTASVVFKKKAITDDFYELKYHHDTMLWCYLASKGKFRYLTNVSSVYNRGCGITETTRPYRWAVIVDNWNHELMRVFGDQYNIEISKKNIYENYWGGLLRSYSKRDWIGGFHCLSECLLMHPIQTSKRIWDILFSV